MYSLFNGEMVQMMSMGILVPTLPLILTTSVKQGKVPARYNCVKCVCICVTVFFDVANGVQLCNHILDTGKYRF